MSESFLRIGNGVDSEYWDLVQARVFCCDGVTVIAVADDGSDWYRIPLRTLREIRWTG